MLFILDHLKRVSLKADMNKMTTLNLAVCFGPVLLCPSPNNATDMDAVTDFKRHVDVLHYLLDIWPGNRGKVPVLCSLMYAMEGRFIRHILLYY